MSFHDQKYSEKRDFIRMTVETPATLAATDFPEGLAVQCQDLSSQGVQVAAPREVPAGTQVVLSIPSPTPNLPGLEGKGEVVRCTPDDAGGFTLGVRFDQLG
ncbi:PilZ domain-containing protein [Halopseudomonas salegens]|uniref:PilZ domain-containing protein n=1 Tax=Halopseudomonas salegens TaxID=1434072 RepID=A0A1H2FU81_9GAMM|nr:PilZ domain-containing protein [Halopseudomonas salegens]SDU10889.1 PilZ domain-containing protein [Halopseudomonas salegens]